MTATINVHGIIATVSDGVWDCREESIRETLMLTMEPIAGDDPDPDLTAANRAVELLGGSVTENDPPPYVKDRVY